MSTATSHQCRHISKPARGLILRRGAAATHYFEYCEEVGCDVWDALTRIPGAVGEPMGLWLPPTMRPEGTSEYVMGVEVPTNYQGPIPEGMELILAPPQDYLELQGPPYDEADMHRAIGAAMRAFDAFQPEGWIWSDQAPRYQLAPIGARGYIEGRAVAPLTASSNALAPNSRID